MGIGSSAIADGRLSLFHRQARHSGARVALSRGVIQRHAVGNHLPRELGLDFVEIAGHLLGDTQEGFQVVLIDADRSFFGNLPRDR